MGVPGPDTKLTDEILREIKIGVYNGLDMTDVAKVCGIPVQTIYDWKWKNQRELGDKMRRWQLDALLAKAERVAGKILDLPLGITTSGVVQKETQFLRQTLSKETYSKRSELTGKDGENLMPAPILGGATKKKTDVLNDDSDNETTEA